MTIWILLLLLLWPLFWVLRVLLVTRLLLQIEFRREVVKPLRSDAIPPHLREAALPAVKELQTLGFHLLGGLESAPAGDDVFRRQVVVLAHSVHPVRAVVTPRGESSHSGECWISLRSTTISGYEFVTSAHRPEELHSAPDAIRLDVVPNASASMLLTRHLSRLRPEAGAWWGCSELEPMAVREQRLADAQFAHLRATGLFSEHQGALSYRPIAAIERALMVLRQAAAQKKASQGQLRIAPVELSEETLTTFDWGHYRQYVSITEGRMPARVKSFLTVTSFLLFAAVLAAQTSVAIAAALVVSLVVHECGHLVGMRIFGFRDTQLLFVPFFGGAAVGRDDKVLRPWQHIVIILLGPLPGIFIALGLLAYHAGGGGPAWLENAALTALVMNVFNLLPILPLDGGQIVDHAVAARFPRARVLFLALSASGLVLLGVVMSDIRFLAVLGGLMLLRLPTEWRLAGLRREMREAFPDGADEESIVRELLPRLRSPEWKIKPTQRLQLARSLQNVLRTPSPGFGTVCFALAGYTAPLWLGVPLAVLAAQQGSERLLHAAEARAAAAGVRYVTPGASAHSVPEEDNAAVLYAKAEARIEAQRRGVMDNGTEIVGLLREAAHRPAFAPVAKSDGTENTMLKRWSHGWLLHYLTEASEERLRYGEKEEALAMAIDGLRLVRLFDSAPGWWTWDVHERETVACWMQVENALAAGATVTKAQRAELRALADDRAEIAYAAQALPQTYLARAHTDYGFGNAWLSALTALQYLSPDLAAMRARSVDQAVVIRDYLKGVEHGEWPKAGRDMDDWNDARASIGRLADVVARLREARVVLTSLERRAPFRSIDELNIAPGEIAHPMTGERLRLVQKGAVRVLAFSHTLDTSAADMTDLPGIEWRLPGAVAR